MERYKNSTGKSGVTAYELGTDFIEVKFDCTCKIY
jgi:hypothetical protein